MLSWLRSFWTCLVCAFSWPRASRGDTPGERSNSKTVPTLQRHIADVPARPLFVFRDTFGIDTAPQSVTGARPRPKTKAPGVYIKRHSFNGIDGESFPGTWAGVSE